VSAPLTVSRSDNGAKSLPLWLVASALIHVAAGAALFFYRASVPERPPVYRIELIGAAGMKKQMGIVGQQPVVETPVAPKPAPAAAERPPEPVAPAPPKKTKEKPLPVPKKATPNVAKNTDVGKKADAKPVTKAAPPIAGSGNPTGKGTDVTNMVAEGIAFPYPGYLQNIVRQIHLNFSPRPGSSYIAEVKFVIHRDGSVSDIVVTTRSGSGAFDREAQGSIEAAGNSGAFGALPSGYVPDVLPVFFTFSPDKPNPDI
jgi:protein TonB